MIPAFYGLQKIKIYFLSCFIINLFALQTPLVADGINRQTNVRLSEENLQTLKALPVLVEGRIAPYDTFARRFATTITNRQKPFGSDAVNFVVELLTSAAAIEKEVIQIEHPQLKSLLGVEKSSKYLSFKKAIESPELHRLSQYYQQLPETNNPDALGKAFFKLSEQLSLFSELLEGQIPYIYPIENNLQTNWKGLAELEIEQDSEAAWQQYFHNFLNAVTDNKLELAAAELKKAQKLVSDKLTAAGYNQKLLLAELHYNHLQPFRQAWIILVPALILGLLAFSLQKKILHHFSTAGLILSFFLLTWGLVLRTFILQRPPVSNMYESVVFVAWCTSFFFFIIYNQHFFHLLRNITIAMSLLILILADNLPMSSDLGMIEAVLRSHYWLVVHVLVIVASYGAFAFACALAHFYLFRILWYQMTVELEKITEQTIYKCLQWGTVLLGAGTILGGVWANESWGRFWGWDPKETWSLITFLAYMALLHGRRTGWISAFGTAVGAVIGFLLVIMTWYGVNYLLGSGLHSYGFGAGGQHIALAFVILELIFLLVVYLVYQKTTHHKEFREMV